MARGASLLVPGVLFVPVGLVLGGAIAWYGGDETAIGIGLFVMGVPLLFVVFAIGQLLTVLRARPSDIVLDAEGVRVEGGVHGGVAVPWSQLQGDACRLESSTDRALTAGDILAANWSEHERSGAAIVHLVVLRGDERLVLAEATTADERASLATLFESIRAGRGELADDDASEASDVELVRCAGCGAAVMPTTAERIACHRCHTEVEVPERLRVRVRAGDALVKARSRIDRTVASLLEQPGALRTNLGFVVGGTAMVLAWPGAIAAAVWLYRQDNLAALRVLALLVFPLALIAGLFVLLRATLVDRVALRLLTLDFGARDPRRPGDPFGCRACGGPLPPVEQAVLVRCVYCDADNVLGLDLRARAGRSDATASSLDDAIAARARERRRWRWRLLPAVVMTAAGAWLSWVALRPLPRSHTLTAVSAEGELVRVTTSAIDEHEPELSPDGTRVALLEGHDPVVVATVDRDGGGARLRSGGGDAVVWAADGALIVLHDEGLSRREQGHAEGEASGSDFATRVGRPLQQIAGADPYAVTLVGTPTLVGRADWAALGTREVPPRFDGVVPGRDASLSPDGTQLAWLRSGVEGDALVTTVVGGAEVTVWLDDPRPKSSPRFSPDGARVVLAIDEGSAEAPRRNLWLVDLRDGSTAALTSGDADACEPSWGRDGWVYFAAHAYQRYDIFRVQPAAQTAPAAAKTPAPQPLLAAGEAAHALMRETSSQWHEHDPVLSADARALAWFESWSRGDDDEHVGMHVRWRSLPDGAPMWLRRYATQPTPQDWARTPAWMPGGDALVYVQADEIALLQRVALAAGASEAETIAAVRAPEQGVGFNLTNPRVSPDGRSIAVQRRAGADAPWELVVVGPDAQLTSLGAGARPVWSADGRELAFIRREHDRGVVHVVTSTHLDGPTKVVSPPTLDVLGHARDGQGRWIFEHVTGPGTADLVRVDDAHRVQAITIGTADSGRPMPAPDGTLYFSSNAAGQYDLWRARLRE